MILALDSSTIYVFKIKQHTLYNRDGMLIIILTLIHAWAMGIHRGRVVYSAENLVETHVRCVASQTNSSLLSL